MAFRAVSLPTGVDYADFRICLPGLRSRVRSAGLRFPESGVPQVSQQEARAATLHLRGSEQEHEQRSAIGRALRLLWRSGRSRRLLPTQLQLRVSSARRSGRPSWTGQTPVPPPCNVSKRDLAALQPHPRSLYNFAPAGRQVNWHLYSYLSVINALCSAEAAGSRLIPTSSYATRNSHASKTVFPAPGPLGSGVFVDAHSLRTNE
jgi:hypothetical protein